MHWHPRNDHSQALLIVMQDFVCFELAYGTSFMKLKTHATRSSMQLTGRITYMIKVQETDESRPIFMSIGTNYILQRL